MMGALAWMVAAGQLLLALPFLVELFAGLPRSPRGMTPAATLPRTIILMPAHDEARQIGAILAALRLVLPEGMRLLVIADNCRDDTAAVARAAGAPVIERHDPDRRGKGHALAWGREHLRADPPEVVIVLDADCRAEPGALARLAAGAHAAQAPVQGLYLLAPQPDAPAMVQVSGFAFLVKNRLRQRGLARLGAPVPLGGTGMALPWALFREAPLGGGHLVEDLAMSVALARAGRPARFDEGARIWSDPAGADATLAQRARWEGGFLQVARTHGLALLGEGLQCGRPGLAWMGLHVMTPPLALLVMAEVALAALALPLALVAGAGGAGFLSLAVLAALGGGVLAAWALEGRPWLRAGALARLPLYLLWKLPNYLRLARGRGPTAWIRTERDG